MPPQSPDLNPIEHLWQYLIWKLEEYGAELNGILQMWEGVDAEWNKIPIKVCMDLIESMPRRIVAVLRAKDGYTKYSIKIIIYAVSTGYTISQ